MDATIPLEARPKEVRTLVNFLKSLSMDWDFDSLDFEHSLSASKRCIKKYYADFTDTSRLQAMHNYTFLATCCLWNEDYSMCPLIHDFILSCLHKTDIGVVTCVLPQIVSALSVTRDSSMFAQVFTIILHSPHAVSRMFWLLMHCMDTPNGRSNIAFYNAVMYSFMSMLLTTETGNSYRTSLKRAGGLVEKLVHIALYVRGVRGSVDKKKQVLVDYIKDPDNDLILFEPLRSPLDPHTFIVSVDAEQCDVFYSQLSPLLLTMVTQEGQRQKCIFKVGDNLNQDALIMDVLRVVRSLCSDFVDEDNIIVYKVLPTGKGHGFVDFVASASLDQILQNGTIKDYLCDDENVMTRLVQSTAFYTTLTYVLCVGDRHLDNILLRRDGKLFHIDYGYIGREPKPFATAVKLCPEIVDAFGGKHTGWYEQFLRTCYSVFDVCRENSNVILDMLRTTVMDDDEQSVYTDLHRETIDKMSQRLACHMPIKQAWQVFHAEIERGYEAKLPHIMDNFHRTWKMVNGGKSTVDANDEEWFLLEH